MSSPDLIFDADSVRTIQVDELSEIANLTLPEIQARIEMHQRVSREAYLRLGKASEELHRRLSQKNNDELEGLIDKVPSAERMLVDRRGYPKPKAPTVKDKLTAKAKAMARDSSDPVKAALMQELLNGLSAPKKG